MLNRRSRTVLRSSCWNSLTVVILITATGCGGGADYGDPVSVSGKVTLDGDPLKSLTVVYHTTDSLPAEFRTLRTKTDDQGQYSLSEVYPGNYTIGFENVAEVPEDPGMAPATQSATDTSLANYTGDNAPTANVSDSNTEFNFDLLSTQP